MPSQPRDPSIRLIHVLDLYPFGPAERAILDAAAPGVVIEHRDGNTQEYVDSIDDPAVEVLLASYGPQASDGLPGLRWIASVTSGVEEVLCHHPERRGIRVTNGSGLHVSAMAEYVMAAMLQVTQQVPLRLAYQQRRYSPAVGTVDFAVAAGTRLRGSALAIVGYGSVGREVARLARACGMRVLAAKARPAERVDPGYRVDGTGDPDGTIPERIVGFDRLHDVLGEADYVVVSVPLTPETTGMIDRDFLAAMRPTAWLVHVGRGGHTDEEALITALRDGSIAGAVIDVFAEEPLPPDSPFWTLPNVILTPHVAGVAGPAAFWPDAAALLAENLRRYAAGQALVNQIDPGRGY